MTRRSKSLAAARCRATLVASIERAMRARAQQASGFDLICQQGLHMLTVARLAAKQTIDIWARAYMHTRIVRVYTRAYLSAHGNLMIRFCVITVSDNSVLAAAQHCVGFEIIGGMFAVPSQVGMRHRDAHAIGNVSLYNRQICARRLDPTAAATDVAIEFESSRAQSCQHMLAHANLYLAD